MRTALKYVALLVLAPLGVVSGCATRGPVAGGSPSGLVDVQLLAFNDFHGTLEPVDGSNGRIGTTAAGGVEFLATHLAELRATNPNTVVVSAGDNIGASTLLSGMFHDEPTIEALNEVGLQVSTVGNHEFDEGWAELYRMQTGGCHPVDGCQDRTPFAGAAFEYLSANVMVDPKQVDPAALAGSRWRSADDAPRTLFPPYAVRTVGGVKIGFIGLVLEGTPDIVSPAALRGVTFRSEVEAGNEAAAALARQGVQTIVVLLHQGGDPATADPNGCDVTGPVVDIARDLSPSIDVVVSGHTHHAYVCTMSGKLVTSAESLGRLVTDIDLTIDRRTGDVVSKQARNVVVTRDVPKSGTETELIDHYRPFYASIGNRAVGTLSAPLTRVPSAAGESAFGDVIADGLLEAARASEPDVAVALANPGGIRADLLGDEPAAPGMPRQVRYSQVFDALPFGNALVIRTLTGDAILRLLEQQFDNPQPGQAKILQVSSGFSYAYDATMPPGRRVDARSVMLDGRRFDPAARYRVATFDFIWDGGDGFSVAKEGTDPVLIDVGVDVLVAHLMRHSPVAPGPQNRVSRR